jgi:hypothetical protein
VMRSNGFTIVDGVHLLIWKPKLFVGWWVRLALTAPPGTSAQDRIGDPLVTVPDEFGRYFLFDREKREWEAKNGRRAASDGLGGDR